MAIEQKARLYGTSIFDGLDFDSISILGDSPPRLVSAIDLNPSDLRVRNAKRLRQMLGGLPFSKLYGDFAAASVARQEVVQSSMEGKIRRFHFLPLYSSHRHILGGLVVK